MTLLSTVTHARLRAAQGDLRAARRILRDVLDGDPGQPEALQLLAAWADRAETPAATEREAPLLPPAPARPEALAERFRAALEPTLVSARARRIARLAEWNHRLQRAAAR